jgi:hypothetical protein
MLTLLLLTACGPKGPPPAATPAPPPTACIATEGLRAEMRERCRVPWSEARPWPPGVRAELVDSRSEEAGLRLRLEAGVEARAPQWIDLPMGTEGLAGDVHLADGPAGPSVCRDERPRHALRVGLTMSPLEIPLRLPGDCATAPPAYSGATEVEWARPEPGGGTVAMAATLRLWDAELPARPPPVAPGCRGDAHTFEGLSADPTCEVSPRDLRGFPGPDTLEFEPGPARGRPRTRVDVAMVWRNITAADVITDIAITRRHPASWRIFGDDGVVDSPDGCSMAELGMTEGRRVILPPGGTLSATATLVLRPGGEGTYAQAGPGCDVGLAPGEYEAEVAAPDIDRGRMERIPVTVTR